MPNVSISQATSTSPVSTDQIPLARVSDPTARKATAQAIANLAFPVQSALYLGGYTVDQGGGQPLQVNGGALFAGGITFPSTYNGTSEPINVTVMINDLISGLPWIGGGVINVTSDFEMTHAAYTSNSYAVLGRLNIGDRNTQNWTSAQGNAGVYGSAQAGVLGTATGIVTALAGVKGAVVNGAAGLTMTYGYNFWGPVGSGTPGAGTIIYNHGAAISAGAKGTNNIDLLLGSDGGIAGQWGLYSAGSNVSYFNGPIQVAGAFKATTFSASVPVSVSASMYAMGTNDATIVFNAACTLTFLSAAAWPGRILNVSNTGAYSVASATSNVYPQGSNVLGTTILAATGGKWAEIQSDGTNWRVIKSN